MTATCHSRLRRPRAGGLARAVRTDPIAVACCAAMVAAACELPPMGPDLDPGQAADVDCSACHDIGALVAPVAAAAPRDWMARVGAGVVRDPGVVTADAEVAYTLGWVGRGHHELSEESRCAECHPVYVRTSGHGISSYPAASQAEAFEPAVDCAAECHQWIPAFADVRSSTRVGYSGSLRPGDLLAADLAAGGSHGGIWRQGLVPAEDSPEQSELRVDLLDAGCGGCHNRFSGRHGATFTCTACHDLEADSVDGGHEAHVDRIDQRYPDGAPTADGQACGVCHCRGQEPDALCRAACYNCHLSGHAPSPVLW